MAYWLVNSGTREETLDRRSSSPLRRVERDRRGGSEGPRDAGAFAVAPRRHPDPPGSGVAGSNGRCGGGLLRRGANTRRLQVEVAGSAATAACLRRLVVGSDAGADRRGQVKTPSRL